MLGPDPRVGHGRKRSSKKRNRDSENGIPIHYNLRRFSNYRRFSVEIYRSSFPLREGRLRISHACAIGWSCSR